MCSCSGVLASGLRPEGEKPQVKGLFRPSEGALVAQRIEQLPPNYPRVGAVLTCGFAGSRRASWGKLFAESGWIPQHIIIRSE